MTAPTRASLLAQLRATSDADAAARVRLCKVPGCEKLRKGAASMCSMHVARWERHRDVNHVTPRRKVDPAERFWSKVTIGAPDECWLYGGTILANGYGQFTVGRAFRVSAHRYAYENRVGPIPDGLTIDHLCNVRRCVNPAHLEPVTNSENVRRRHARERGEHV